MPAIPTLRPKALAAAERLRVGVNFRSAALLKQTLFRRKSEGDGVRALKSLRDVAARETCFSGNSGIWGLR
jgi:hypothetical protein